jgi:hypothetical protein
MPLLDHFHPPLTPERAWESFHSMWAAEVARTLNRRVLPKGYFAEAQVHIGGRVEVDVPTFQKEPGDGLPVDGLSGGVALETWAPPVTSRFMPAIFPDEIEVRVLATRTGATLVGAIEFISPGNKDRPEARRAFAAKCASYLQQGIGLIIVDVVTERQANLHDELIRLMELPEALRFPSETMLYVVSYRPFRTAESDQVEFWPVPVELGQALPIMPLALRDGPTLPVELETTYTEACLSSRL